MNFSPGTAPVGRQGLAMLAKEVEAQGPPSEEVKQAQIAALKAHRASKECPITKKVTAAQIYADVSSTYETLKAMVTTLFCCLQ